ncbi:MAG: tRNA lysidine(34) synthetase TilS [Dehalococcoidales bacterium]|nr:tRNA lysidine(34) synthetase TilS [Dehalococcoidales bacterium]
MLEEQVQAFIAHDSGLRRGDLLVVGVSGGPDSVALLHALAKSAAHSGFSLHVAHFNHGLRGDESEEDARFVDRLARAWGLQHSTGFADVKHYGRERGLSTETAAREVRYAFFADLVRRLGAAGVAVGHTADDQVETILLHLLRGTGLAGLRGMPAVQNLRVRGAPQWRTLWAADSSEEIDLRILRPLLQTSRAQVEEYLTEYDLPFRRDRSNAELEYTRNRVRHDLIPLLHRYNPAFERVALRMAGLLTEDYAYLERMAGERWPWVARVDEHGVHLDLTALLSLERALRRLVVRQGVTTLVGDASDLTAGHVEDVISLAASGRTGATVNLARGLLAMRTYGEIVLTRSGIVVEPLPSEGIPISLPGETAVEPGGWVLRANLQARVCEEERWDSWHADFDLDRVGTSLVVRRRRPGDRLRVPGLGGSKKLQDVFVDRKIPRWERDAVPVVSSPDMVLWAVGHVADERAQVTERTERVLCLRFEQKRGAT